MLTPAIYRDERGAFLRPLICARWRRPACRRIGLRTISPFEEECAARDSLPGDAAAGKAGARDAWRGARRGCGPAAQLAALVACGRRAERRKRQDALDSAGIWHGFLVLSDVAGFAYKVTDYYSPRASGRLCGTIRTWPSPGRSRRENDCVGEGSERARLQRRRSVCVSHDATEAGEGLAGRATGKEPLRPCFSPNLPVIYSQVGCELTPPFSIL